MIYRGYAEGMRPRVIYRLWSSYTKFVAVTPYLYYELGKYCSSLKEKALPRTFE